MQVTLQPSVWSGEVRAIASKSYAHRMLIAAALSDQPCRIYCTDRSEDIMATVQCLRQLGAQIYDVQHGFTVFPIKEIRSRSVLDCGECGTTLRFLLPVAAALGAECAFVGHGRLAKRPLSPLYEVLVDHGIHLSPQGRFPLYCQGKLRGHHFHIAANVSSQFVGGLLMALPLLSGRRHLILTETVESAPYIDMTLSVLQTFGVMVERWEEKHFVLPEGAGYHNPESALVEGDWSNAAFWLAAGALRGRVCVTGLQANSFQGDSAILHYLQRMGGDTLWMEQGISTTASSLHGVMIDARDIPDLIPILAVMASTAQGRTVVTHAQRLRLKESDRIHSVCTMLRALGGQVTETEDGMVIDGVEQLTGGTVDGSGDHRIVMAAAVASCLCSQPVTILGAEAVNKSYPGFFEDLKALGGQVIQEG